MSFDKKNFGVPSATSVKRIPSFYSYYSDTDTAAQVIASGYFNDIADELYDGDAILIKGSDGVIYWMVITSANGVTPVTMTTLNV